MFSMQIQRTPLRELGYVKRRFDFDMLSRVLVFTLLSFFAPLSALALVGLYEVEKSVPFYDPNLQDWRSAEATDCFSLERNQSGVLRFSLRLVQQNGHTCSLDGELRETEAGILEYRNTFGEGGASCILRIEAERDRFRFEDLNRQCQRLYCGARAQIVGTEIPFASKVEGTSCEIAE